MKNFSIFITTRPCSPITEEIIAFYEQNGDKPEYLTLAAEFVKTMADKIKGDSELRESFAADRKSYSFYNCKNYERSYIPDEVFFKTIMALHHWYIEIAVEVFPEEAAREKIGELGLLERQVSPPLSAYTMVPFNKMDITQSKESYGLLFD